MRFRSSLDPVAAFGIVGRVTDTTQPVPAVEDFRVSFRNGVFANGFD